MLGAPMPQPAPGMRPEHEDRSMIKEIEIPIETRPCKVRDFSVRGPNRVLLVLGQDWQ
jgi:hypothetical protein